MVMLNPPQSREGSSRIPEMRQGSSDLVASLQIISAHLCPFRLPWPVWRSGRGSWRGSAGQARALVHVLASARQPQVPS
jgi:hypothetical protein